MSMQTCTVKMEAEESGFWSTSIFAWLLDVQERFFGKILNAWDICSRKEPAGCLQGLRKGP